MRDPAAGGAKARNGDSPAPTTGRSQRRKAVPDGTGLVAERSGINLYSESGLHARMKELLSGPEDRLEALVDGKVVDIVKADGELVEVQTGSLGKIASKVLALALSGRKVRVVHPIAVETTIRRLDPATGELVSTRRSPKRGDFYSLFDELVNAPSFIASRNVTVEVALVRATEIRVRDGSGSWRRRGDSTRDRLLDEVLSSRRLRTRGDWLRLVPGRLPLPWSSTSLGEALGIGPERARKILYCLAKAGLVVESGRDGRRKLYEPAPRAGRRR
jgi:hypothetical protein